MDGLRPPKKIRSRARVYAHYGSAALVFGGLWSQHAAAQPLPASGVTSAFDPSTLQQFGDQYTYFADGQGIISRWSYNMEQWANGPVVFSTIPAWTETAVPGFTGYFWAPDVAYFDGLYHLYYAVSTFGSQVSAIGMATNPTLNFNDFADYKWTDQGPMVESSSNTPYNAIDPSILQDTNGSIWMSFGSYFSGIYLTKLDPTTGKPISSAVQQIAASSQVPGQSAIEASYLYHEGSYYYLFVNYGTCCDGVDSTYNVRMGRASSVNGPYLDENGVPMTDGGGTTFLETQGNYIGPGQVGIMAQGSDYWLSYFYHDGNNDGTGTFAVQQMYWTDQGWPSLTVPAPTALSWKNTGGTGDGATWDAAGNQNWNYGSGPATYTNGDNVTFNDANNGHYSVTVNTTVTPGSVVVNNSLGNYTISGAGTIGGTGSLTKSGTGTLTISTANAYSGGTTVTAGKLLIEPTSATTSALPTGALSITGGTVQLADNVTAGAALATSDVNLTSLSITGNGTFDIGNNRIIIDYSSPATDPIASIAAWIKNGFYGTSGPAIISSDIATDDAASGLSYGIGYADGADGVVAGLPSGEIEIMFTLLGDANLDGTVNGEDFSQFSHNLGQSGQMWDDGDFNYDGTVNSEDFSPFSTNLGQSAAYAAQAGDMNSANGLQIDVPEPATAGLFMLGSVGALARRKRRTRVTRTSQSLARSDVQGSPEPLAKRIISGVTGNIKIALRVGVADIGTIEARRSACFSCKACIPLVAGLHKCTDCGCIVEPKTQLSSEKCPRGKWGAVQAVRA
jgi:arabinan endo-1,5-alpha-L-arabinosidase